MYIKIPENNRKEAIAYLAKKAFLFCKHLPRFEFGSEVA